MELFEKMTETKLTHVPYKGSGPAVTPKEVVQKLNQEIAKALADPEIVKRFREQGVEVVGSTPTKFSTLVEAEIQKWGSVVRDANVRLE